ncbi:MAG: 3-isopropylmalate dehydratase small subunit [Desulfobacterales bacterium]|nr:3-isopropylmalate dehydratase small subunit [Desulfobacterales bacterium]
MIKTVKGRAFVFGHNLDTDQIYPGRYLELTDAEDVGKHAMEGADPDFTRKFKAGDIIAAGSNFGCGSSREQAVLTLKTNQVGSILAESFARIFYRNAINLGLPVLICPGVSQKVTNGDTVTIDLAAGLVVNERTGQALQAEPLSAYVIKIIESGGIAPLIKKEYADK